MTAPVIINAGPLFRANDPATLAVTPGTTGTKIRGVEVITADHVPLTLAQANNRTLRWREASADVRGLIAGHQMAMTDATPTISGLSGLTAPNDDTTVITITGTLFEVTATAVLVDSTGAEIATDSTRVSATSITFKVPGAVPAGTYHVRVTDADLATTFPTAFTVTAATITAVTPSVPNNHTTLVTVTGTNFYVGVAVVLVPAVGAPVAVGGLTRVGATSLTFNVPAAVLAGVYHVKVTNPSAAPVIATGATTVTAMTVTAVSPATPATVDNDDTAVVTVTGTNFYTDVGVRIVDAGLVERAVGNFTRVNDTSLTFTVPVAIVPGVFTVKVTNTGALPVVAANTITVV